VVLALIVQAVIGNPYASLGALAVAGLAGLALATRLPARSAGTGSAPGSRTAGGQRPGRGPGAGCGHGT
jgi:hypothetical protein